MAKTKKSTNPAEDELQVGEAGASADDATAIEDGSTLDYITGGVVPDTEKERVRQRIARALFHEYGISVDDMVPDSKLRIDGRLKKLDLVIFEAGAAKDPEHIRRIVICEKEPPNGRKSSYKMRSPEEAEKEFSLLKSAMTEAEHCKYGLWTNGLEFFFFQKEVTRFDVKFKSLGDWPLADESIGTRDVASSAKMRRAEPEMLRTAFRRCHNFIHGNEGMSKDAAFWQFLYLIFCKMYDERQPSERRRFWAGPTEQFEEAERREIKKRVNSLFEDVKKQYKPIFTGREEISLSDRALSFMVSELAKYDFGRTDVDAKGAAYQEIVGTNLRGDRGQYFTPRGAIKLMVKMLDPKPDERVLDPACGTGGFLVATVAHILAKYKNEMPSGGEETADSLVVRNKWIRDSTVLVMRVDESTAVRGMMGRDRLRPNCSAVACRCGRLGPPVGPTAAVARGRELGASSSARAFQGAGRETPAHRCRDAGELGLAVAVVRLALLPDGRSPGNGGPLAPRRMATAVALQVQAGPSAYSLRTPPVDSTYGRRESALGRGANCQ